MLPFISVILPVLNGRATLPQLLDELLRQNYPSDRFEVLVIDRGSTDGTADLVRRRYTQRHINIRLLVSPNHRVSVARNLGVCAARGRALVFIDGHSVISSSNLLEDTAAILSQTGAGCLCRQQSLHAPAETKTGEAIAQVRSSWLAHSRDSAIGELQKSAFIDPFQGGFSYRRELFERVGLFDESFDAFAPEEFNVRVRQAGIRTYTDPRLIIDDRPPATLRAFAQQRFARGCGLMQLIRRHSGAVSLSSLAPLAVLVAILLTPLGWLLLPRLPALLVSLPIALVAGAVVLASLQLGLRHGMATAWKAPWIFAVMGCAAGVGIVVEALWPARPVSTPAATARPHSIADREPLHTTDRAA
jgi:succinoglycan biosynthesis protein ExoA